MVINTQASDADSAAAALGNTTVHSINPATRLVAAKMNDADTVMAVQNRLRLPYAGTVLSKEKVVDAICNHSLFIIYGRGRVIGYLAYKDVGPHIILEAFFVEGASMRGRGWGKAALTLMLRLEPERIVRLMTPPTGVPVRMYQDEWFGFVGTGQMEPDAYAYGEPGAWMERKPHAV